MRSGSVRSVSIAVPQGNIQTLVAQAAQKTALPPVVFVHGMGCAADLWQAQLKTTAQSRDAIAISLRGHGTSTPPPDDDYSPAACAADLFAVLDALGLEHMALVGHSYGTWVAIAAAAAQPQRLAQLILVDPPIDCTRCPADVYKAQIAPMQAAMLGKGWRSVLQQSFRQALMGGTPETHLEILARLDQTPEAALRGTSRELFTFPAVNALDTYLAVPAADVHLILADLEARPFSLHALRPALPTTAIPNTGHWLMLDAPEAFAQALNSCLATV
ncbi:alpha/beta hydrolase [Nodosilinea sp. LEGE 06152]|nr:alpha/beta hydrolase [Nodosilinea sp. LEGE 06152]